MNTLALIEHPEPMEEIPCWEKKITGTLTNGGLQIEARGNSIAGVLAKLRNSARASEFENETLLSTKLTYWQLDEEIDSFEVSCGASLWLDGKEDAFAVMDHLLARVKASFAAAMARQGVPLFTELGALQEAQHASR